MHRQLWADGSDGCTAMVKHNIAAFGGTLECNIFGESADRLQWCADGLSAFTGLFAKDWREWWMLYVMKWTQDREERELIDSHLTQSAFAPASDELGLSADEI